MPKASVFDREVSLWDSCQASGGINGQDARATRSTSVNDCRLSPKAAPRIRVKDGVAIVSGAARMDMTQGTTRMPKLGFSRADFTPEPIKPGNRVGKKYAKRLAKLG